MKTDDLRDLHALRELREQRAEKLLAAQQQRCLDTQRGLDDARQKLQVHRQFTTGEAQKIYGLLSEGVSINAWHAAQDQLNDLAMSRQHLESGVRELARTLATQQQEREGLRLERLARQRQSEAWQTLLLGREQDERRASEHREEADDIPLAAPQGKS